VASAQKNNGDEQGTTSSMSIGDDDASMCVGDDGVMEGVDVVGSKKSTAVTRAHSMLDSVPVLQLRKSLQTLNDSMDAKYTPCIDVTKYGLVNNFYDAIAGSDGAPLIVCVACLVWSNNLKKKERKGAKMTGLFKPTKRGKKYGINNFQDKHLWQERSSYQDGAFAGP
jgi:hypothetical protein